MPKTQHPTGAMARGSKRLAGRFHQLRTRHCRTGKYLKWTKDADTAACGWCQYKTQTREYLFKNCKRRKTQQKILWAEVREIQEEGRAVSRSETYSRMNNAPIRF